jgi:hypothetical protein
MHAQPQETAAPTDPRRLTIPLTVAALRRVSPLHSPTRTLAITEAEYASRGATPLRVTAEQLTSRPRSNPRSRTPMRYESPLSADEFRREYLGNDDAGIASESRRITLRPGVGAAARGATIQTAGGRVRFWTKLVALCVCVTGHY